jgi:hypothetical protein
MNRNAAFQYLVGAGIWLLGTSVIDAESLNSLCHRSRNSPPFILPTQTAPASWSHSDPTS